MTTTRTQVRKQKQEVREIVTRMVNVAKAQAALGALLDTYHYPGIDTSEVEIPSDEILRLDALMAEW